MSQCEEAASYCKIKVDEDICDHKQRESEYLDIEVFSFFKEEKGKKKGKKTDSSFCQGSVKRDIHLFFKREKSLKQDKKNQNKKRKE